MAQRFDFRDQTGGGGVGGANGGSKGIGIGHTGLHDRGQRRLSKSILKGLEDRLLLNKDGTRLNKTGGRSDNKNFCGDVDLRIARDGTWYHEGSPIRRPAMVRLFASVLKRDDAGDFWLETPVEKCPIGVEDAPFVAVEMSVAGSGRDQRLTFRTNVDEKVIAGPDHPIRVETAADTGEPSPYIRIRDGLEALIARAVFYDLVELGIEESRNGETVFGVWSDGAFFALGDTGEA